MKTLNKSQYEMIAGVLKLVGFVNANDKTAVKTVDLIAKQLAKEFEKHDSKFDYDKFLKSCGIAD